MAKRNFAGKPALFVTVFCVAVSLIHVYYNSFGLIEVVQKNMIHISLMMGVIFLTVPAGKRSPGTNPSKLDWVFFALSLAVGIYLLVSHQRWVETFLRPNQMDLVYAAVFMLLIIEAARRTVGVPLTTIAVTFLVYTYVGPWMPGALAHMGFGVERIMIRMTMTSEGILGVAAMVSASYIFMFILFASFFKATKASEFFNDLASALTGGTRGGPAKASIFASALTGTISGSSQANVATTGSFTIPLMISVGYKPYFAAAVEAIASTGGVLMPPIMGAAAFIMSSYLGVPYNTIMIAAITPAILYYWTLFHMVDLGAVRWNLSGLPKDQLPRFAEVMKSRGHLLAPLVAIIGFLLMGFSPLLAAFIGIVSVLAVSFLRAETRLSWGEFFRALEEGAKNGATIAIICGIIGFIIASVGMTGIGQTIGNNIIKWSGGTLAFTAFFCMIAAIILGMGLPGPACYIITATVAAPALVRIGVPQLAAHFFAFYFGTMSSVVPPVALTSYTAGAIAQTGPNRVAFTGLFLGSAGLLLPYMYINNPVLLGIDFHVLRYITVLGASLAGLYSLAIAVIGNLKAKVAIWERVFFALGAFLLITADMNIRSVGICVFAAVYVQHLYRHRRSRQG
ncbi:MAG: TRAP transporter permease [Synergistales bacterium]|nr:TRAP transporter permease [Synergistales bacterium]